MANIGAVRPNLVSLPRGRERDRLLWRVIESRRLASASPARGRAWINGREVGGTDPRLAHLADSHD
jgi:hypothetical protein